MHGAQNSERQRKSDEQGSPLANTPKNIAEIYAERAMNADSQGLPATPAFPRGEAAVPPPDSGPVIYGGTMPPPSAQDQFARKFLSARSQTAKSHKRSPFNLMVTMILVAIAIVLYVGNVIAVQQLLKEVADDQAKLQQILNDQEMLKAQINRMSSLERIRSMAEGDLGLRNPKGPPQWIEVDGNKVKEIQQELSSQRPDSQKSNQ